MPSLSVALIVKNEAHNLPSCLDSVHDWVDEIIILDSGSSDNTQDIALAYGAKFYENLDWQGFGKQRQLAQQYVTSEFVLWLDADEHVTPELKQSILQALSHHQANTVYQISRLSEVFGKRIRHSGWYPDYVVRLYPTKLAHYNDALVHEKVVYPTSTKLETLTGDLLHYTYQNLHHYLSKSAQYGRAWSEQNYKKGKKSSLTLALIHSLNSFIKMYFIKRGFLDGKHGILLAILSAQSVFNKYAELWVAQQGKSK